MNNWILFTSLRHFKAKRKESGDTSTFLSIIGILSGVMTMITVIGVMNGFQGSKIDIRVEVGSSHITLEPKTENSNLNTDQINNLSWVNCIYKSSDFITAANSEWDSEIIGVEVNSVPENILEIDVGFNSWVRVISGKFDLMEANTVIIGYVFAKNRHIAVGDKIYLLSLKGDNNNLKPEQIEFDVRGIYKTGSGEYDENRVFISNSDSEKYFIPSNDFIYKIKINDRTRYKTVVDEINNIPRIEDNYLIKSWRDYNTTYFSALKNEKDLMTVLIGLIFLVVGVNIFNSVRRSVYLRFEEISVLKTMGATSSDIQWVFILESFFIGFIGASIGVLWGLLVVNNINLIFSRIELVINNFLNIISGQSISMYGSSFFYINKVPVHVFLNETIFVFLSAVTTSVIAAIAASRRVSLIRPGEVIRNE
ncbi:MAG: ABC transporter permease [Spirochaetales bacterium]|nr:ABC transporter permease [Spirochaetales bacterium]